jgi:hypothetical protein
VNLFLTRIKEPSFHHTYTRQHTTIDFGRKEPYSTCFPFTSDRKEVFTPWFIPPIFDPTRCGSYIIEDH